ncbi:MAG: hypothetical protein LBE13_01800, partial [Bacteroidales bacterium]|nr:hypothetical protein [Bacteroidales bacterium]
QIAKLIRDIYSNEKEEEEGYPNLKMCVCEITRILQSNLNNKEKKKHQETKETEKGSHNLITLYNSFNKDKDNKNDGNVVETDIHVPSNVTFWHFNALGDAQITAFKEDNWVLSLIEYGEVWRTNSLKQVKTGDVIFLFKRGGTGYIGAFKALDPPSNVIEAKKTYSSEEQKDIDKYDIYKGIEDGATLVSGILVTPIAYNFKGVGYLTVRRRTIERMNDSEAVKYLINGFKGVFPDNGNKKHLEMRYKEGYGKLDEGTPIQRDMDTNYLNKIFK